MSPTRCDFLHLPPSGTSSRQQRKRGQSERLCLEFLEKRLAPATFVVNHVADDTQPGSLRDAIQQADNTPGPDTIQFQLPAGAKITLLADLPPITDNVNIQGPGADQLTIDGAGAHQALQLTNSATLLVNGLTIANAVSSTTGAAINVASGNLTVAFSVFANNAANNGGAVAVATGATATLISSTFAGNTATNDGGAVASLAGATTSVINSTFASNLSGGQGGALFSAAGSTLSVKTSTISGNQAGQGGGGIANAGAPVRIDDTIVAGNTQGISRSDVQGALDPASLYNLIGDGTGMTGVQAGILGNQVGSATAAIDPRLAPLANNGGHTPTMALLPDSPAIDAGDPNYSGPATFDQRGPGFSRLLENSVDIGSFEVKGAFVSGTFTLDLNGNGVQDPADPPLAGATLLLVASDGSVVGQAITSATGFFRFIGVPVGNYTIALQLPGTGISPQLQSAPFSVTSTNGIATANLSLSLPSGLQGQAFLDNNGNHQFDQGDTPLGGVTVTLTGTDVLGNSVNRVTQTDANGVYTFPSLVPGIYSVTETRPAGVLGTDQIGNITIALGQQASADFSNSVDLSHPPTPAPPQNVNTPAPVAQPAVPVAPPVAPVAQPAAPIAQPVAPVTNTNQTPTQAPTPAVTLPVIPVVTPPLPVVTFPVAQNTLASSQLSDVPTSVNVTASVRSVNFTLTSVVPVTGAGATAVVTGPAAPSLALIAADTAQSFSLGVATAVARNIPITTDVPLRVETAVQTPLVGRPPALAPQALTPLQPANSLMVISSVFESDERVDFVEALYRQDGSAIEVSPVVAQTQSAATPVAQPSAQPAAVANDAEPEVAPGSRLDSYFLRAVAAGAALVFGGYYWKSHRRNRRTQTPPTLAAGSKR